MNRVSPGTMTVVVFAILVGLGGAFVVRQQMNKPQLQPLSDIKVNSGPKKIIVPVAGVDLEKGRELALHDIVIHSFTPEQFAKSKFAGQAFMSNTNMLFGRMINKDMPKGSLFLPDNFYAKGFGPGVADRLQPGFRAVTVPIENVGAVTGFAQAGSIVDVLFRSEAEGERESVTMTLLEQIEVLALAETVIPGQRSDVKAEGTVTLSVTPAQAKVLKVVEGRGEISLTIRNPDDFGNFEFAPVKYDNNRVDASNSELLHQVSMTSSASSAASSANESSLAGSMNLVLEDAAERVTMNDLLGIPNSQKKTMTIYSGGARNVQEFETKTNSDRLLLNTGKRVQTPIAGRPPLRTNRENVAMDYLP